MFYVSAPVMAKDEILKRYERIKPVTKIDGKLRYLREFTNDEVFEHTLMCTMDDDLGEEAVDLVDLKQDFFCLHYYGYHCLFVPLIADVLSQMPDLFLNQVCAFEIVDYPEVMGDIYKDWFKDLVFRQGFYVSVVKLYKKKS